MQGKGRHRQRQRRAGAAPVVMAGAMALSLAACGDPARDLEVGTVNYVSGFAGAVAADEPRAVLVGRDILSAGGTAADAASAMALTMAVTLPSSVGLGGGGLCLVHDPATKTTETLDFLPPASPGPVALPAMGRGLFALQARYGRLRWQRVVAPAEELARFGERVSRALGRDLAAVGADRLTGDVAASRLLSPGGQPLAQGDRLVQVDLAATLGRLRERGVGDLYGGQLGRQWIQAAQMLGSRLTMDDLRAYQPRFVETARLPVGNDTLHTDVLAGQRLAEVWKAGTLSTLPPPSPGRVEPGGAGLVAVDSAGGAAVCGLTMNGAFGTGQALGSLGMLAAAPAPAPGQSGVPLALVLQINHNVNEFRFGGVATRQGAAVNLGRVLSAVLDDQRPVDQAIAAVAAQPSGPASVTAVSCPQGLPPHPQSCSVGSDGRGGGFGVVVGQPN